MLILHHDFTSPAAAVAVWRMQRLLDEGLSVGFSGLEALGLDASLPVTLDVLAQLQRWTDPAAELGLTLRRPAIQPPTAKAHLLAALADTADLSSAWRLGVYRAYWERGADLGDDDVLLTLASQHGLDPEAARRLLADRTQLAALRQRMAAKRREGVGGVPVLELDGSLVSATIGDDELRQLARL